MTDTPLAQDLCLWAIWGKEKPDDYTSKETLHLSQAQNLGE